MNFIIGELYTRREICDALGGEMQTYLPQNDGIIVAGCFRSTMNPDVPKEVQVGNAPKVMKKAQILSKQDDKRIPVFIKQMKMKGTGRIWKYAGVYEFDGLFDDEDILTEAEEKSERYGELAYVLRLKPVVE